MNVAAVAERLGVKKSAVRKAIGRGTLPATLVPGGRRGAEYEVDESAVLAYQQSHRREAK